jgi:hypothetical protein
MKKSYVHMNFRSGVLGSEVETTGITASNYVSLKSLCRLHVQQPVLQHRQQKRRLFKQTKKKINPVTQSPSFFLDAAWFSQTNKTQRKKIHKECKTCLTKFSSQTRVVHVHSESAIVGRRRRGMIEARRLREFGALSSSWRSSTCERRLDMPRGIRGRAAAALPLRPEPREEVLPSRLPGRRAREEPLRAFRG